MTYVVIILIAVLLACLIIGVPVSVSMGFTALIGLVVFIGPAQINRFAAIGYLQGTNINQMVPPLFIMMAALLANGGIASDIYNLLQTALRKIKGGLALATILACTVFAALCGSSPATAATIGRISVGQMIVRGYKPSFAVGTVAAGGTLGIMIPPSLTFVLYGIITETSIAKLFMAGLFPGIMLSAIFCISIIIRVRINPTLATIGANGEIDELPKELEQSSKIEIAEKINVKSLLVAAVPALILILLVLVTMYTGIASATEAAGFGAVGALVVVACRRRLTKAAFSSALSEAARTSCMILLLIIMGLTLSYVISYLGFASNLAKFVVEAGFSPWGVMIALFVIWFILGMFMDPGSMVILTVPFIFPTLIELGFDAIWIGVVSTLCVEIGMITPPVGLNLFVLKSVTGLKLAPIIKGSLPYLVCLLIGLVILCIFPQISLFLPSRM